MLQLLHLLVVVEVEANLQHIHQITGLVVLVAGAVVMTILEDWEQVQVHPHL
jgi:hypothetical protein